jgi:hypothetical protein
MELSNISLETPVKIEAGHDVGKSTIFRAVLFAITGKNIDGTAFDGCIYPKKAESLSELTVEVEIEQSGVVFNKKATGSEKRQNGSDETELQRSVTSVYSLDFRVVGKAEYDAKILEVFGNFHLFSNPDYFRNLKKEDKRSIFAGLVKLDKNSYFNGLSDKKTVSGKIKAQKDEIDNCNAKLSEFSKVQEPEKIEVVDYDSQLSELRKQRQEAEPKFTQVENDENFDINLKIAKLQNSGFIPEPLIPLLPEIEKPVLIDVEGLKKELERVQLSEPDTNLIDGQISNQKGKISLVKSLRLQIENYDENVKDAKCVLCQVCINPDCQFKQIEVDSIENLQDQLSKFDQSEYYEKSLENLESQKIDYLRDFEAKKESKILRLEKEISEAIKTNGNNTFDFESKQASIQNRNIDIILKNVNINILNSNSIANFETDKAQKIAELKKQLHLLPNFNYEEIDTKINDIEGLQKVQQSISDNYSEQIGAFKYAKERISILSTDLQKLKEVLYASERELIKIEKAENDYYNDFENLINAEMPENIKVSLFKKNLSNDDRSEVFEIEFNGSVYAGNGKTIAFYIWLCSWFQTKFGKNLPIFIDEAIILNQSLYSDVKNTVILMRNDECKTLKIS